MSTGRPTAYRPEYVEQARKLCRNGATDREIAYILGVCVRTFYRWRAEHDEFAEALVDGKELADDRVERALYERACGYEYDDVKIFHPAGAKEPVIVPVIVHVPADVGAARQWLASRRPQTWAGEKPSEEESDFGLQLEKALARSEACRREKEAEDAERFKQAVAAGVAEALAGHGLRE